MIAAKQMIGAIAITATWLAQASDIPLSPGEIDNLGIRFVQVAPGRDAGGIEATARVVLPPTGDAVVSATQSGLLTRLAVNVGDEVDEGQILAELTSPDFIGLQREFLDAVNAQWLAQTSYARDAKLHAEGIIAERRLDETTTRRAIANATLDEHRQLLRIAGMRDADIDALESRRQLQGTLIVRAPFGGAITARLASAGERLDPMSPIYRLVDLSQLWLDISIPHEQVTFVRPGALVRASGGAGDWSATVQSIGSSIDPSTQVTTVRARLAPGTTDLMPGQFMGVRVTTAMADDAIGGILEVPAVAVIRSNNDHYVFVRTASGVQARNVDVLSIAGRSAFIRGRIDTGESVAASGLSVLKSIWLADGDVASP